MKYTISVYDDKSNCKVCGEHASKYHADGCEVGGLRKQLHLLQRVEQAAKVYFELTKGLADFAHIDTEELAAALKGE